MIKTKLHLLRLSDTKDIQCNEVSINIKWHPILLLLLLIKSNIGPGMMAQWLNALLGCARIPYGC